MPRWKGFWATKRALARMVITKLCIAVAVVVGLQIEESAS